MRRRVGAFASFFVATVAHASLALAEPADPVDPPIDPIEEPIFIPPPPPLMVVTPSTISQARPPSGQAIHRGLGFALVGTGVLTTAVGIILAVSAKNTYEDAVSSCIDLRCPSNDAARANDARTQANVGGFVLIGGLVAVGAGVVLWLTAPSRADVVLAPAGRGLSTVGRF